MDIFKRARQNINPGLIKSFFDAPGSYEQGGEFFTLSPLRSDNKVGSFHISLESGTWIDHANGDGGDFIELVAKAKNISPKAAAELIAGDKSSKKAPPHTENKNKKKAAAVLVPIKQVPDSIQDLQKTLKGNFWQEAFGEAVDIWKWINSKQEWIFCTVKFLKEDGSKNVIPIYRTDKGKWKSAGATKAIGKPEPLGVHNLGKKAKILIVEGEKCAKSKIKGYSLVTWWGGTNRAGRTNWDALKKFGDITIWPDYDTQQDDEGEFIPMKKQPGMKAALEIRKILPHAKILDIYKNGINRSKKSGWDIADCIEEERDPLQFINDHLPNKKAVEEFSGWGAVTPRDVKERFIDRFYHGGLKQFAGTFWEYVGQRKYWRQIHRADVSCDLQLWLDESGAQDHIEAQKGSTSKFITETEGYIRRHRRVKEDNPFISSCRAPFINMRNGAIQIKHKTFDWHPFTKEKKDFFKNLHLTSALNFDYDPSMQHAIQPEQDFPVFYKFIKDLVPKDYLVDHHDQKEAYHECLVFICQIMAYSICPIKDRPLFFAIYGDQETGKSFLVKIIKEFIGDTFCVERPVVEWANRFFAYSLWGKKVLIEPDMKSDEKLPDYFIKMYSGDVSVSVEGKNKDSQDGIKMSLAMFFVSNYKFQAKAIEGLERRIVMVPFKNKIEKQDIDNFMLKRMFGEIENYDGKMIDERPAILAMILDAWRKLCEDGFHIAAPQWSLMEKEQWVLEENTAKKFVNEKYSVITEEVMVTRKEIYQEYKNWCHAEDNKYPYRNKRFFEALMRDKRFVEKRTAQNNYIVIKPNAIKITDTPIEDVPF